MWLIHSQLSQNRYARIYKSQVLIENKPGHNWNIVVHGIRKYILEEEYWQKFCAKFRMEQPNTIVKPSVILFDVYETLLDMSDIERRVNHLIDSVRGYRIWFELFMQYCFVENCTGQFNDFSSIGKATMKMAATSLGHTITDDTINDMMERLKYVPVHDGISECLSELTDGGYRIAALTNAPEQTILERMEHSGLVSYFEHVMSAEHVKKYKPCIEVYEWAAKKMEVPMQEILFVSAHSWDIAGAANAGMKTAFIQHSRQMFYPLAPKPDFVFKDLNKLVGQLRLPITSKLNE